MTQVLTLKQRGVLELLIQGSSDADIAHKLNLTIDGVRFHVRSLFRKYKVTSRTQLISKVLLTTYDDVNSQAISTGSD